MQTLHSHSHSHSHQTNSENSEIELTITHANGVISKHHYIVPNDNSVQLVCTDINNNQKTIYPLVEIQNRPISGQSSRTTRHYRPPGAAPGAATLSAHLRDKAAQTRLTPQIPIPPPPGFSAIPNRLEVPPSLILNSSNLFHGSQVVGRSTLRQPQKGGPYTCQRCGDVFEISQALAAHVNTHYRAEETVEQRKARQAAKYKRKVAQSNYNIVSMSLCETMPCSAGQNLRRKTGESSSANITRDLGKRIKLEPN